MNILTFLKISGKKVYTEEQVCKLVSKVIHDVHQISDFDGKFYSEMNMREKAHWEWKWLKDNL